MFRVALGSISSFLKLESAGGLVLIAASLVAMAISNSPLGGVYGDILSLPVEIRVGGLELAKPLRLWIDDGLMAVFFLLVGLEVKREVMQGELSTVSQIALPLAAFLILALQATGVALFTTFIPFRVMGSNYEAVAVVAGQCGFGLGATPTAIANMQAVCERYGYAPQAFIIVPVVGAFLIDIANAIVISAFAAVIPALR